MKKIFLLLLFIKSSIAFSQFHGQIQENESKEKLIYATVANLNNKSITQSNTYGYFSISANKADKIKFSIIGFEDLIVSLDSVDISKPQKILLTRKINVLEEISVKSNINSSPDFYKIQISKNQIKQMPMLLGEKDPMKAIQFLPGVQESSEGSSSLNVRGGNTDQNLLILDETTVYNANHLFGFFSTFNPDPIQSVNIYKSYFPAQFGGRLSSIIDFKLKEGNKETFHCEGGIGLISSKILFEGPIIKNKASFLISARRTYADLIIKQFQNEREKTGYFFGDLNVKLNTILNSKNELFFSSYLGNDSFYQKNKIPRRENFLLNNTFLNWGNITLNTRWNKIYSSKLFHNLALIYTKYQMEYGENTTQDYLKPPQSENLKLLSGNSDVSLKIDFDYYINQNVQMKFGGLLINHRFSPRDFSYNSTRIKEDFNSKFNTLHNVEVATYLNIIGKHDKIFYETGLRLSYFQNINILKPEPRILLGYSVSDSKKLSISYSKMNQYLHMISNTGNGLPTDVWIPSTDKIKNSSANLFNIAYAIRSNTNYNFLVELYYKKNNGNLTYKSGANFLGIGQGSKTTPFEWENSLLQGQAWNYGYELSANKNNGKLTGFLNYTLAWSISKFEELNNNQAFYNNQDRRHVFESSLVYKLNKRVALSSNFVFASGNALSIPKGIFFREDLGVNYLEIYNGINGFRAENYHRLDCSVQWSGKRKKNNWEFSIYNVYNRKNPFNYETNDKYNTKNKTQVVQISRQWLLPILPSISYNFKF